MATAPLTRGRPELSWPQAPGRTRSAVSVAAVAGVGMLVVILYAAFAHGAVTRSDETRVEVAVAALAGLVAFGWLWLGTVRLRMARLALAGVGLLAAFAVWSGLSVIWSVSPDQSWIELNRVFTYVLVVCVGAAVGASIKRGVELVAAGFVAVAIPVTLYALGQKLFPGLHVPGVFTLDQTGPLARLQEPLGYWNALALFIVLATPAALAMAADETRSRRVRLSGALILQLMLTTIPFTYSRGGLGALVVALAIGVGLSIDWLRSLAWLALAVVSALPAVLVGLLVHDLSGNNLSLSTREGAGAVLAAVVLGSLALHALVARQLPRVETRIRAAQDRLPRLRRLVPITAVVLAVCVVIALSLSSRGLTGEVSNFWHSFTTTHVASNVDPSRFFSAASENRWVWWKEAAGAFSARPWLGWGAGSFPVVHLLFRQNSLPVQQPHSLPLQFLAETGIIGGVLGMGALVLLVVAGVRAVRRRLPGRDRLLAAALLAGAGGFVLHCCYDWDWNIPALGLPAFLFLGVLTARVAPGRTERATGSGLRATGLAWATLLLCACGLSVLVPQIAADDASAALVQASSSSSASLQGAQAAARAASQLDPLSDQGLIVLASVAVNRHELGQAELFLRDAVSRDPSDGFAWRSLAIVEATRGDLHDGAMAEQRALDLDPMGSAAWSVLIPQLHRARAHLSPTRGPTPLR